LGEIKTDSIITVEFIFKNNSDTVIDITGIDKSCTCTNVKLNNKKLSPDESSCVYMTVDTNKKKGKFKEWSVLIASTEQKFYKLTVSGEKIY